MKKLTKKLLHELAISMPIIDEMEQQNFMGGTFYYDSYGNYLTQQGPSNDIKIASDINNLDSATALNDNPDEVLEAVFQSMAGGIGFSGDVEVEDLGHAKYGEARNGKIIMNALSPSFGPNGQNNFFDFMCTLIHEKHHLDSPHDAGSDESEYLHIERCCNHLLFLLHPMSTRHTQ